MMNVLTLAVALLGIAQSTGLSLVTIIYLILLLLSFTVSQDTLIKGNA
jgi:regulator of sirC expression with transglutaminase-like and TPR domain